MGKTWDNDINKWKKLKVPDTTTKVDVMSLACKEWTLLQFPTEVDSSYNEATAIKKKTILLLVMKIRTEPVRTVKYKTMSYMYENAVKY